ncbi:MAG: hypothetical protein QOH61_1693 [Chloroflexota bacterium]|nr:hypothetical protein [Chloroflexota bacterium]
MRIRLISSRAAVIVGLAIALVGCSAASPTAAPATTPPPAAATATAAPVATAAAVTLRLSDDAPVDSAAYINDQLFASEVERLSGGSVKITIFPAGQLYAEGDILAALQRGELDLGVVPAWSSVEPAVLVLDLPFQFTSWDDFHKALDGAMGKVLIDAYAAHDIQHLYFQDNTVIDLIGTNKHIVKLPADLAGLRMRTISEAFSQAITLWGAAPTEMSGADTYAAVQRGTVDGLISGVSFFSRKWYEVTPYITQLPFSFRTNALQMSMTKWKTLSADQQTAIKAAAANAQAAIRLETPKSNDDAYGQLKGGLAKEFYVATADEISQWQSGVLDQMHAWYLTQSPDLGQKVLDALK